MSDIRVSLLHPFTPKAAGVVEESVARYHSQPHRKSMELLAQRTGYHCSIEYFTERLFSYQFRDNNVATKFYPVSWTLRGDHRKWKKQTSRACLRAYGKDCPPVTIINMSGHSSPFSHDLGIQILSQKKKYIAMLGGQHYTDTPRNRDYYRNAHHMLVHTHLQKEKMQQMDLFKDLDIRVFPLGVNCDYFTPGEAIESKNQLSLLYIGRIIEWKRAHLAIEVVKRLKELNQPVVLRLAGPVASESYAKHLEQLVIDYALTNEVFFEGYQDHTKVRDLMRSSDLLLLPSENETFGMVIVESMSCGVPVAGMKGGHGPDEVIVNGYNGVLTVAERYVEDVVQFVNQDETRWKQTKAQARETALRSYSIEETFAVLKRSVDACLK